MAIDFNLLERTLAEHKVYDAWQYVQSLQETLNYMKTSYDILIKVHDNRITTLANVVERTLNQVSKTGSGSITINDLNETHLNIGGYEIDDVIFMKKSTIEFFHYGRISMDVLFQIVNAALLGDESYQVEDKGLLPNLLKKLSTKAEFGDLLNLLTNNKNDVRFQYLMAFDNYIKHIKTILITVKNSILIGNDNVFQINAFSYGNIYYPKETALTKIQEIYNYIISVIDDILNEILKQIPNCLHTSQRIQEIHFKHKLIEREGKNYTDYMSFFIDVPNSLSDIPSEIKVYPLIIKPNREIYSFDFRFDKIFIRKAGTEETDILGVATLKNGLATNEFYRIYDVNPCSQADYGLYVATFSTTYDGIKIPINFYAMDGTMVFISEDNSSAPSDN